MPSCRWPLTPLCVCFSTLCPTHAVQGCWSRLVCMCERHTNKYSCTVQTRVVLSFSYTIHDQLNGLTSLFSHISVKDNVTGTLEYVLWARMGNEPLTLWKTGDFPHSKHSTCVCKHKCLQPIPSKQPCSWQQTDCFLPSWCPPNGLNILRSFRSAPATQFGRREDGVNK